jgi:hypothetical protein
MQQLIPWIPVVVSALNLAAASIDWTTTRHRRNQRETPED